VGSGLTVNGNQLKNNGILSALAGNSGIIVSNDGYFSFADEGLL